MSKTIFPISDLAFQITSFVFPHSKYSKLNILPFQIKIGNIIILDISISRLMEKFYPEKSSTSRKSLSQKKSSPEKIHNSCPIFMKLGENIHLVSALSFSNISLIGSKLWIFSRVDFFRGRLFLEVELFSG